MKRVLLAVLLATIVFVGVLGFQALSTLPKSSSNGYVVLKCDFHVHSNISDGFLRPSAVVDVFKSYGYDAIALTDHNNITGWSEALARGSQVDLLVIQGEEISTRWSNLSSAREYEHIVGLFLTSDVAQASSMYYTSKYPLGSVEEWFRDIHLQGGIGIVAHPWDTTHWDQYGTAYYNQYAIDGWEFRPYSPTSMITFYSNISTTMLYAKQLCLFDTDFHKATAIMATRYTLVMSRNRTVEGIKEALLAKRTVIAYDNYYYGSPENLALFIELQQTFKAKLY